MGKANGYVPGWPWIAVVCAALLLSLFSLNPLSKWATRQASEVTTSAVTVYAALRTLNLFLSAAQEIEVGGSFVVSGSMQPLKTLEPIDDTVESVAKVMLAISVVSGVLSISFEPFAALGFALLLAGLLLAPRAPPLARRMQLIGVVAALVVPLLFAASGVFSDLVTRAAWDRNAEILSNIAAEIASNEEVADSLAPGADQDISEAPEEGFLGSLWRSGADGATAVGEATSSVVDALGAYRQAGRMLFENADDLVRSYVEIIAVLLFKVAVLPGVLILVCIRLIR